MTQMQAKAVAPKPSAAVRSSVKPALTSVRTATLQRKTAMTGQAAECKECRKKRQVLQRTSNGKEQPLSVPPVVDRALSSPGYPLDIPTRNFMESRFGHDFSRVRVHTDSLAAESAQAVNAKAYTVGQDILFDHGKYQPQSHSGRHLLAHELAHTVQQGGVQRYANDVQWGGALEPQLEREAETAARAVAGIEHDMHSVMPIPSYLSSPVLSRAAADAPDSYEKRNERLKAIDVEEQPIDLKDVESGIRRFKIKTPFPLPEEKGPVLKYWEALAKSGGLESIVDITGNARSALKQERPSSEVLRNIWLTKVGWSKSDAAKNWKAAGGDSESFDPPKAGGQTCEMDHIVELQIGGTNVKENLQALDKSPNASSGSTIRGYLASKATEIRNIDNNIKNVILHFDSVSGGSKTCQESWQCCKIEQKVMKKVEENKAKTVAGTTTGMSSEGVEVEHYPIKAGFKTELLINKAEKDKKKPVSIYESEFAENKSAATLVPGMILKTLNRQKKGTKSKDTIDADIDTETGKTKLPITLEEHRGKKQKGEVLFNVDVEDEGNLKLDPKSTKPNIKFTYPYLSKGTITKLDYNTQTGISGEGKLRPSIPFLSKMELGIAFSQDDFRITAGLDPDKIKLPLPGFKLTRAELALILVPEFKPSGFIEFELSPGGRKIIDGKLTAEADANGFVAKGKINGYFPGVDKAEGNIEYRNQIWSGGITIASSQIKIPYIKSGELTVGFNNKDILVDGGVVLNLPGDQEATVKIRRSGNRYIYVGTGVFKLPVSRLRPVKVNVFYDGTRLEANGETSFELLGLKGDIKVNYLNGRFSGDGKLFIKKSRAEGEIHVKMSPAFKFSGDGTVTYKFSDKLIGTAGIILNEDQSVRLKGAIVVPKPIELFRGFGNRKSIWNMNIKIPIPGASIGPIGLKVVVGGEVAFEYHIGPGFLENVRLEVAFNPLEEDPNFELTAGAKLNVPAQAGVDASVKAGIAIDAAIASVSGNIIVTGSATLKGGAGAEVLVYYKKTRFSLDAKATIEVGLRLGLRLDASVEAEAGVGPFSVETKKVWNLAAYSYDTGLKAGLIAPFHYASDEGFKAPSLDDIQWIKPNIDPQDMLVKTFRNSSSKES